MTGTTSTLERTASGPRRPGLSIGSPAWLLATAIVLCVANFALHYPGELNNDALNQYREAASGRFTDWHPPVMAWVWSLLLPAWDGPQPMLLLQLSLHWLGLGLIGAALARGGRPFAGWCVLLIGAYPVFLELNGSLWKDVLMSAAWTAAAGVAFWFRADRRRLPWPALAATIVLIAFGLLVRTNAVFGYGPLLIYALSRREGMGVVRMAVLSTVLAVVAVPATGAFNRHVLHAAPAGSLDSLLLFDVAGVARYSGDTSLLLPPAQLSREQLLGCYRPYEWDMLGPWGTCPHVMEDFQQQARDSGVSPVRRWIAAVTAHPLSYLNHRLRHFNAELNFLVPAKQTRFVPFWTDKDSAPDVIRRDYLRKSFLTWPAFWLSVSIGGLLMLARSPASPTVTLARTLLLSGVLYALAFSLIGVAAGMRYYYWTILTSMVSIFVALPDLRETLHRQRAMSRIVFVALALVVVAGMASRLLDAVSLVY